ncbi:MAG: DUF4834 family protein [Mediterranea sp.]|jgi:hypothetical protein|nr:DUF4834 family protein [Mediterranea sp.]
MFSFLGFILFFVLLLLFFGLALVSKILKVLFGWGRRSSSANTRQTHSAKKDAQTSKRKKLFEGEGEYVDFEEMQ